MVQGQGKHRNQGKVREIYQSVKIDGKSRKFVETLKNLKKLAVGKKTA